MSLGNSIKLRIVVIISAFFLLLERTAQAQPAQGPLRVQAVNRRYFSTPSGKIVYLTGSHVWNNLQDIGPSDPPPQFDWDAYLDFLTRHNHNFIRLWRWELTFWKVPTRYLPNTKHWASPHPWRRTGPGTALDGKPKFDLTKFNEDYFRRLRARVLSAQKRGIYVSIMLFEGWALQFVEHAWDFHPFNAANNVNGIDGDIDRDGKGLEIHELRNPAITALQEAYVRKVIDTVNDLDNVLYEISNENHPASTKWQYHMIRFIKGYEKNKPKQHPVGMVFQFKGGSNETLLNSPADWISPNPSGGFREDPPDMKGRKVILNDTDHLWGIGGNRAWVWKSFLRGLNPIFMDPYDGTVFGRKSDSQWEPIRRSLGYTRRFAQRLDLSTCLPQNELSSTSYCLASPGREYLVYQPKAKSSFSVKLVSGRYQVEWFNPVTGQTMRHGTIEAKGEHRFIAPFDSDAVLYLSRVEK